MKKAKLLLLALAAMLLSVPNLQAQEYIIGAPVPLEDNLDGLEVVFEGYTDDSNLGGYLGNLSDADNLPTADTLTLTRFEGAIPQKIVWVIEQLDTVSTRQECEGYPLYNLRNKQTGKYIGTDWSRGDHHNSIFMVSNKEDAAALQFHYSNEGGTFGSAAYGSFDGISWNTNGSAITIVDVYPKVQINGNRGFICNEANEKIKGFCSWQDTNVWIMHRYFAPTTGRDFLNEFLNNMPSTWQESYKVGTDPGYVGDAEKFQQFYDYWIQAVDNMDGMSDEECQTLYEQLNELWTWLQSTASQVPVEDGGYYYFFTANSAFTDMDNGNYAIYAPKTGDPSVIGWKAFDENDPTFIWQVKAAEVEDDGTVRYSVQNMGSGLFIGQASSKADSQPIQWTSTFEHPTVLTPQNHAGHWWISSARDWDEYPPRPFHQEDHQGGAGTAGRLVLYSGGIGSPSDWFIRPVPQEKVDMLASMQSRIDLMNFWAQNSTLANGVDTAMNAPGYISSMEVLNNYKEAVANVDTMLNYSEGKTYTDEEYAAAYNTLKAATDAFIADRDRGLPDGYYRIRVMQDIYQRNDSNMYMGIIDGRPGWNRKVYDDLSHVWKVTRIAGNKYNIQNMGNNKYISKGDNNAYGSLVNFSDQAEVPQLIRPFEVMNGQFYITNGIDTVYQYDTNGHNNGTNSQSPIMYYDQRAINNGSAWKFEPVSDEDFAAIQAGNDQATLNYALSEALATAKCLYKQNTTFTYGEKLITNASQIYSNNSSINEGKDLGALIDANNGTWWNSAWDTETNPSETHYLRFETTDPAGWPDSVAFYFEERNDASWHRSPSKLRVSVSNDAAEWTVINPVLEKGDITTRDLNTHSTDPVYVLINGIKGYKYVRFEFLASQPYYAFNNHPIVDFSETNILPVTGVDAAASLTESANYKNVSVELFNAIQKGQTEFLASAATQATIDLLNATIKNFNNVSVADSAVSMSKLNIQNFSAGSRIGEFPEDALETYLTEAQAAIDKYEAIGSENVSGSDITTVVDELRAAYDKLYPTMVQPQEGKWYVVKLCDPDAPDWVMAAGGHYAHTPNSSRYSYWLSNTEGGSSEDVTAHYVFKADTTGGYIMQNAGTGQFFGPETGSGDAQYDNRVIQWYAPHSVKFIPFGQGQVGLQVASGKYICGNATWFADGMEYLANDGTQGYGTRYAWELLMSAEDEGIPEVPYTVSNMEQGRVVAITLPFDIAEAPEAEYGPVQGYEVIGKITEEGSADSIVTAYKLRRLENDAVAAGTPVVYIVDDMSGSGFDAETLYNITFNAVVDGAVTNEPDTVNGLAGTLDEYITPAAHYGYFLNDSVRDEPSGTTIGFKRGYLMPWLVEETMPDAQPDVIVYVEGAGMLNNISNVVIEDQAEKVDVYSIDGVLLRRNVARGSATDGLAKGIYIVGKEKVLVK